MTHAQLTALDTDTATLAALHARLAERAGEEDLLDVAYRTVDSPFGPLLLAATEQGLVRLAYEVEGHDRVLSTLAERISPRVLAAPRRLDPVARELDEYFAGRRREFTASVDLRLTGGFRHEVLGWIRQIGYGHTASYAELAERTGRPRAVRAVGSACATNPIPLVVPCHRVLRSDGTLGGYLGGLPVKRALLALESASTAAPAE